MGNTVTWMTVADVCKALDISKDTFQKWRTKGTTPPARRLPNGQLRFDARDVVDWMDTLLVNV